MNKSHKQTLGAKGEQIAKQLLIEQGYKILTTNFRCNLGEIDIIARDSETLYLVEVKTRATTKYGLPQEAVGKKKLRKITDTGHYYQKLNPGLPKRLRIAVVAVIAKQGEKVDTKLIQVL